MKGFLFSIAVALIPVTNFAAEILRLSGTIEPSVSLDQLGPNSFSIQSNQKQNFSYEVNKKKHYRIEKRRDVITVKKRAGAKAHKFIYLTVIAQ